MTTERARAPHVMQVVHDLSPGGSELLALAIAEAGAARGVQMSVFGLGSGRALVDHFHAANIRTHAMDRRPGVRPHLIGRFYRLFRRERVTAVVTHHLGQLVYAGLAARLAGARLIHVEHEYYTLQPPRERTLLRLASRLAQRVVVVSEEIGEFLTREARVAGSKVVVVPNGVDLARFTPKPDREGARFGLPRDAAVIGTIGRLDPAKDHLTMLSAFEIVRESVPAAHLVIVGEGACRTEIEAFIAAHGLGPSVSLLGQRFDIPTLLADMDVFALSSINEGLPLALLEAMATARPVVTTDVGAAGGVVRRAGAGIVVPPKDASSLARALLSLLNNTALARRFGALGRSAVEDRYSLGTTVESYLRLCGVGGV